MSKHMASSTMTLIIVYPNSHQLAYQCWKDEDSSGKTKETLCSEINAIIVENDIIYQSNSDIRSKILYLHNKFKDATDFINGIGQGILNNVDKNGNSTAAAEKTLRDILINLIYISDMTISRPSTLAPFPMSNGDPTDVSNVFERARQYDKEATQFKTTFPVEYLSATSNYQRPSKQAQRTVDSNISNVVEESIKINREHFDLMQKKFKAKEEFYKRQLQHQKDICNDKMMFEKRRLEIEEK
ncbi:hypothetical protein PHYBLDRAFT_145963 [Phycomyces blakesleeanus NRRL 1555(-)]|uniref:Uncharacterized protein n=1 Tax=Phycomyces blakesleeanus (strain ATCC 8743b / DSM 1359 / FGSC 10004 / NBRC 33097 / NRRL 1555) TaxID=763407 RepID=A0A167MER3_PHYB8|nr:hypothetical protein PHYBLDRAFT_145963 [Phycomyces blakesleeanus NRRL 1555(-)]OAD72646.1 hypothetical protein PHYBLDRAFT_145963 [Phycomyces blakesleeanus NRRL 1555(-)]|eukprot:XP_018290686.1 hypothetical protein PHYBLDRAFT_145963 [Phycomyces blakesleeanus NRRL 1555(-)]